MSSAYLTVNVDGLTPGVHEIVLIIRIDLKYACFAHCCECAGIWGDNSLRDTVIVTVEPKSAFIIPGFRWMEWMLAIAGLVSFARRKKPNKGKENK